MRFLPGLWADSRRSFPSTQLAFSIWVPGPLLTPYSQNTFSSHRNPSNSQYIRAAQLMASLSAQPPRMSARITDITGLDKPICPTARMSARITGITGRDKPICPTARMSARETGITGHGKPICPTAPDVCSRNGYHKPQQAYLPNHPDVCSRNVAFKSQLPGYLFAKWRPKVTTTRMVCSFYLKYRSIVFSTVSVSSGFAFVS